MEVILHCFLCIFGDWLLETVSRSLTLFILKSHSLTAGDDFEQYLFIYLFFL